MELDPLTNLVVENIRAVMARKELLPAEVNRKAGLGQTGINDILSGKSKSPKLATIYKVAVKGLEVPFLSLLRDPNEDEIERQLYETFGSLPADEKRKLLGLARVLADQDRPDSREPNGEA